MADNNKESGAQVGSAEESANLEDADDDDPSNESKECVKEMLISGLPAAAPPENLWYHGELDRQIAEDRLREAGEFGSYLVRESERKPGSYVLSYRGRNGIYHFRITALCGDFYIGGRAFDTLSDLIGFYTKWSCLLKEEQLKHPVAPPEPVDDRRRVVARYPFVKVPDTDELSFEKGDIFIVQNEMGDGWLWVTSLKTNEEGQVHKVAIEDWNGNIDPVENLLYFHGHITKRHAIELLMKFGQGSFLVRPSDHSPGDYTLFFLCGNMVQTFRIEKRERRVKMGGRYFDSVDAVIQRYSKEEIVANNVLLVPVNRAPRDVADVKDKIVKLDYPGPVEDIYASIRHLTGPHRYLGRNDKIDMGGYLYKKSQKTKKWKALYFVLIGTEGQFRYFENEKKSKPKGLIDLTYSSLYPVHDSFFERPNCFQLVTNASNDFNHEVEIHYLCADDSDKAQKWVQKLKSHCVNTQSSKQPNRASGLKELWSLNLEVVNAHNLPSKHLTHPCCVIAINSVQVCRTHVADTANFYWGEEFVLDDIPCDVDQFTIHVYNQGKRSKHTPIALVTVSFNEINQDDCSDKWHTLQPSNPTFRTEMGSIRIRARYIHEIIMPQEEYASLKMLFVNDFNSILTLSENCGNDRISLAKALLQIYRNERRLGELLKKMNSVEIEKEDEVSTLFRATSLATTLMDQYMKTTATEFVEKAVQETILHIMESKQSCEVNPEKLENSTDLNANIEHFLTVLNEMLESTFKATDSCPMVLRHICDGLQSSVRKKWPNNETVRTQVVGGFIFLRLLCPAILNPKTFNLIQETLSKMASRTLVLVAKALQNLANLVEFGTKESFMGVVNSFIKENKSRMIMFLDEVSNVDDHYTEEYCGSGDLSRELATIHQICATHLPELKKSSETQVSIKKLTTVTEILTMHKKSYLGNT